MAIDKGNVDAMYNLGNYYTNLGQKYLLMSETKSIKKEVDSIKKINDIYYI